MSLQPNEVEKLVKWIEYHIKGYENEQNPQILASYIKSLILRQATEQRMIAVLADFMDDKAESFVKLLEEHLRTKDFSIPENSEKVEISAPQPKKAEIPIKIKIEEVRPENLTVHPISKERQSKSKNSSSTSKMEKETPSASKLSTSKGDFKSDSYNEKHHSKRKDRKKSSETESRKKRDKKKSKTSKRSRKRRSPSPYSDYESSYYSDYETEYESETYDYSYDYDYDQYSSDDERTKRKSNSQQRKKAYQKPSKSIKKPEKKQLRQKQYLDSYSQKKKRRDTPSNSSSKPSEIARNKTTNEPSELEIEHKYIVAVCGIPPPINTIGHILKEFNRFGLIHGIQIVQEQNMALIEFNDVEAAYRVVNSRHSFFHNNTIKVDYAIPIDQDMLDSIAEKIRQRKLAVEKRNQEKLLEKQKQNELRSDALAQAAALASMAVTGAPPETPDQKDSPEDDIDRQLQEDEELLLKVLSQKIDQYENSVLPEEKESLRKDIKDLSDFLDIIS